MSQETLHRRFLRLTVLNILTNVTVPLVGLVDTAMLGHLAEIRFLAGVALASILFDYLYWSFGFLRMGTTGTTAQAWGRGDVAEVYRVLYRYGSLGLAIGLGLLIVQWPLRELGFAVLSGQPGVEQAGRAYFDARIWAAPATLVNYTLLGWFLGREESRNALIMAVIGNLGNVALNYVFIIRMGLAAYGAGLATALSQYLMLATALLLLLAGGRPQPWRRREILHAGSLWQMARLNRDILIRTFMLQTAFAVFTNFGALLGTAVLAANAVIFRIFMVAAYFIDGAAFAAESLSGIFKGQGDCERLRATIRLSLLIGVGFASLFLLLFLPVQRLCYRLLTSHGDVIDLAASYGLWLIPVLIFGSVAFIYDGVFIGLTQGRALRNAMLISTLGVFLPTAILALVVDNVHLLWSALAAFMVARALTLHRAARRLGVRR